MDKELEKILKRSKRDDPKPVKEEPKKVFPKNLPYDHLVFTKVVRLSGFNFFFVCLFALPLCVGFFFPGFFEETIYTLVIYAGLAVIYVIVNWYRYHFFFKGWQERLPFQLKGWNEMVYEKKMFCDLCWNHAQIEVLVVGEPGQVQELVQAALKIFCKKSEKAFYDQKMGSSLSHGWPRWKIKSHFIASGSANPEVMRYMKNLFEKELATIAKKTGKIKEVKITLTSDEFEVPIEISGGD